jgi:hypothetical protein
LVRIAAIPDAMDRDRISGLVEHNPMVSDTELEPSCGDLVIHMAMLS